MKHTKHTLSSSLEWLVAATDGGIERLSCPYVPGHNLGGAVTGSAEVRAVGHN